MNSRGYVRLPSWGPFRSHPPTYSRQANLIPPLHSWPHPLHLYFPSPYPLLCPSECDLTPSESLIACIVPLTLHFLQPSSVYPFVLYCFNLASFPSFAPSHEHAHPFLYGHHGIISLATLIPFPHVLRAHCFSSTPSVCGAVAASYNNLW